MNDASKTQWVIVNDSSKMDAQKMGKNFRVLGILESSSRNP